ncbi:hypothetical protein [Mesorhizobium sp. M0047]|uniref:GAP1-N1 domain-containing protein n=1 Tax=Mesorhizobium sp. M0047 TaxID=2956859 RepID=UPI00333BEAE1
MMVATVHQTLHGYSDGHRLISGSLSISGPHARTMVVMSDLSGPGIRPEPGYLTGYPLEGEGKYVLARTWAAPEMPRPGCVWTHSLIIDNADLATLSSAEGLILAFRRPNGPPSRSEYAEPIAIPDSPVRAVAFRDRRTPGIVEALYTKPDKIVLADTVLADDDERLVVAIWMQQWPRLRRSFGFCTLSGMDRSGKGVTLDLQLVRSSDRQHRMKFPDSVTPSETLTELALKTLIDDIEGSDTTQIREFLRRSGGDVDGGRRAMLPLCRLHSSLFAGGQPDLGAGIQALADLDALGPKQARSVRSLIARTAVENVDRLDEAVFDFVLDALAHDVRPNEKPIPPGRIGFALWSRSPKRFFDSVDTGGIVGDAAREALASIPAADLVEGLESAATLASRVVEVRPELLERPDFWGISDVDEGLVTSVNAKVAGKVAAALLDAGRSGPARWLVEKADAEDLASALNDSAGGPAFNEWVRALVSNPDKAAAVLASGRISQRLIVVGIANAGGVDDVPNDYGEDPWLIAARSAPGALSEQDETFFAAFLMTRALGFRSHSQADLIRLSYTTLYRAFEHGRLHGDLGRLASSRLSWGIWSSWDNCLRLQETVVAQFIDRNLDPETFGRLTDDVALSISLIDEAARTARGRRYLNEVRKSLADAREKAIRARADYIASKIK